MKDIVKVWKTSGGTSAVTLRKIITEEMEIKEGDLIRIKIEKLEKNEEYEIK